MKAARVTFATSALALVVFAIACWPRHLEHWDEVQLELGMRHFQLEWHQPHPPGYVLFVLAGRLISIFHVAHPGRVLSLIAIVAWLAIVTMRAPERARTIAAPLLALVVIACPPLFIHATTGRTYVVESVLWVATLLLLSGPLRSRNHAIALGALIGVAGGFRPTVLVWGLFALPFWLYARRKELARRDTIALAAALVGSCLSWIFALAVLASGLARYRQLATPLLRDNVLAKSVLFRGSAILRDRLPLMIDSLWIGLGPFALILVLLLLARIKEREKLEALDPLLFGSAIAFFFYLSMIYDSDGYSLSYVLPLLTWTFLAAATLLPDHPRKLGLSVVVGVALWSLLPGGLARKDSVFATRAQLQAQTDAKLGAIRSLPPRSTLVVTGVEYFWGYSFRVAMSELPDYPVLQLVHDRFIVALDAEHPYLAARDRGAIAVGPEGVDLASLPFFTAEEPLRRVLFTMPKETAQRIDASCLSHATTVRTSRGGALTLVEVGPSLRIRVRNERLVCELP